MNDPFATFNANTTRWSGANALALAHAARLAYEPSDDIKQQVTGWGFPAGKFKFIESENNDPLLDTQVFVAGNDEMVLVSFRGTQPDSAKDWLTDLDAVLKPFAAGRVHKGFYDALDAVWPRLLATISKARDNAQSLWFTGHSLGAALACVAVARMLLEERQPVSGLYTFGQPRTGDLDFAHRFDAEFGDKTFRFVNNRDIVTRLAPRELFYAHAGRMMFFNRKGELQTDDHFWNKFLLEVEVGIEAFEDPPALIKDHNMDLYIANVQKNVAATPAW